MSKNVILFGIVGAVYLILIWVYLVKQQFLGSVKAVRYKLLLSGIFCAIGLQGVIWQNTEVFSLLIFWGLLSSFIGDYFLVFIKTDEKKFMIGILFFALTQLLYIAAMIYQVGISYKEVLITICLVVGIFFVKIIKKPHFGKTGAPLVIYIVLVAFMAVKAQTMLLVPDSPIRLQVIFSIGALCFLASDMMLGTWRFLYQKKILYYLVSISYFVAQFLIATTICFP